MNITALLTGRGNNTLQDKNILPVLGKPLLHYPALAAQKSGFVNHFYVSSDCPKILSAAEEVGYEKIVRPEELARPDSQHIDAIKHALAYMVQEKQEKPDLLVVMLANSVTIKTEWIDACIGYLLEDETLSAAAPVYREMDHHPYRAKKLTAEGLCEPFFDFGDKHISTNRQDLVPCYFFSHNFWVLRVTDFESGKGQQPWTFMGERVKPYIIEEAFDVHDLEDIQKSEEWLKKEGLA
ncbi:CMP-N-acetylneuraminic acid synthetase [Cyclonatronum proteinivorum]|uniref:CMP-N-acetylneuraminic acid synthetase n=1 Tax=Cyclonatronum proteinivorum TaxID=1457365 RepID=A0A345UMJ4_9BACT|nr:NTP transferase domain-containing protein [Cyclonatronum proteinivorum]AXJ01696.1 CMP-N-acetylneuraminic acid synthetase [Cyclonatronum proteinivorum]